MFTRETNNKPWALGAEQRVVGGGETDGGRSRESRRCSEAAGGRSVHEEETSLANGSSGDELVSLTTLGGGDETGGADGEGGAEELGSHRRRRAGLICFDLRMGVARTARTQEAGQLITRPALRTLQTPDPALSAASKPPRRALARRLQLVRTHTR